MLDKIFAMEEINRVFSEAPVEDIETLYSLGASSSSDEDSISERIGDIASDILGLEWFENGCTKFVFMVDTIDDYVFKIPFTECTVVAYDDDGDFIDEYTEQFCKIEKAFDFDYDCYDYCSVESAAYQQAVYYGIEDAFAETQFLGYIFGDERFPVYFSERADKIGFEELNNRGKTYDELIKHKASKQWKLSDSIYCAFAVEYGISMTEEIVRFFNEYSIGDLHRGNCGVTDSGRIVFIDYSGYYN